MNHVCLCTLERQITLYKTQGAMRVIVESQWEIAHIGHGVVQAFALPGCYAAYVVVVYRSLGTAYRFQQ
jgi:hypothetical protein